jgi:hypothetical protein
MGKNKNILQAKLVSRRCLPSVSQNPTGLYSFLKDSCSYQNRLQEVPLIVSAAPRIFFFGGGYARNFFGRGRGSKKFS